MNREWCVVSRLRVPTHDARRTYREGSIMARTKHYWLMKVEPAAYSIDQLERDGTTSWEGVRNYQARNLLRDEIKVGDGVLFYASNADPSGVAGIARVVKQGYPDPFSSVRGTSTRIRNRPRTIRAGSRSTSSSWRSLPRSCRWRNSRPPKRYKE